MQHSLTKHLKGIGIDYTTNAGLIITKQFRIQYNSTYDTYNVYCPSHPFIFNACYPSCEPATLIGKINETFAPYAVLPLHRTYEKLSSPQSSPLNF